MATGLFGGSFADLLRQLNLSADPSPNPINTSQFTGFGQDFLNDTGMQSLFDYALKQKGVGDWGKGQFNNVRKQYEVAAAADPTVKFSDFLSHYDFDRMYDQTSRRDRGEFPGAFNRGFRFLAG